jgi:copper chaperone
MAEQTKLSNQADTLELYKSYPILYKAKPYCSSFICIKLKYKIMEAIKFKTDIKCSGCVAKATPHLNAALGEDNWEVDTANPSKVLTVVGEVNEGKIKEAVAKAGFKAERL